MLRTRSRRETHSRPTFARGSIGTARVWDEATRAARRAGELSVPRPGALDPAPEDPEGRIAALLLEAMRSTLDEHLGNLEAHERLLLARVLQARALAWLGPGPGRADGSAPIEGEACASDNLPGPVGSPMSALSDASTPAPHATPAAAGELGLASESPLRHLLRERLLGIDATLAGCPALCERLIELALGAIAAAQASPTTAPEETGRLDLLRRRLAKLELALQEARAALLYVSKLEALDTGIPSIYRAVQGLPDGDPHWQCKRQALELLFQANLDHQKRAR